METLLEAAKCGDCSSRTVNWISLNKIMFLCNDCASLHIEMGRHVSMVRPLAESRHKAEVELFTALHATSNAIWEHALNDNQKGKSFQKKPEPSDPMFPVKSDFAKAKHLHNAFAFRFAKNEQNFAIGNDEHDLSLQLHAAVRTSNLETSLRLIACGADPNYFHPEKGMPILHVAAVNNQAAQAELLFIYGADPGALDNSGRSSSEAAKEEGHTELAAQLMLYQFWVTDAFSRYLCGRSPDHKKDEHFVIPRLHPNLDYYSSVGRPKLQKLSNEAFAELAMDIFDEVDRRELDRAWKMLFAGNLESYKFPSLSLQVITDLSGVRNATRRRLAKLNQAEFTVFCIDVLKDAKRRYEGERVVTVYSDDEPLYDHVASEDYFPIDSGTPHFYSEPHDALPFSENDLVKNLTQEASIHIQEQLSTTSAKMETLLRSNEGMQKQMKALQEAVDKLLKENAALKAAVLPPKPTFPKGMELKPRVPEPVYSKPMDDLYVPLRTSGSSSPRSHRPMSMFESRRPSTQPLPTQAELLKLTGVVTTSVKEFKELVEFGETVGLAMRAERVVGAVLGVLAAFSSSVRDPSLQKALLKLSQSAGNLQSTLRELEVCSSPSEQQKLMQKLLNPCAFDVILASKCILEHYQVSN